MLCLPLLVSLTVGAQAQSTITVSITHSLRGSQNVEGDADSQDFNPRGMPTGRCRV